MSSKIFTALGNFLTDISSIENATLTVQSQNEGRLEGYSRIEIEGDTIGFINTSNDEVRKLHVASVRQANEMRGLVVDLISGIIKNT
ncbi:MAG: hypothetical protein RIG77_25665 [Cyclobacteriaceae bacterium]